MKRRGIVFPIWMASIVKKIVDETVRWTALRAGDLDYIQHSSGKSRPAGTEEADPGRSWWCCPTPWEMPMIYFNCSKPPFDNKKVRQAVAYAIDKKEIVKAAFWGLGEIVNNQPFLNRSRMYIPVKDREVDLAKAKQLLAEAGYPNGFKTEFLEYSYSMVTEPCQVDYGTIARKSGLRDR